MSPPPHEFIEFRRARRLWQELGWKPDERTIEEEELALLFIRLEDHYDELKKRKG